MKMIPSSVLNTVLATSLIFGLSACGKDAEEKSISKAQQVKAPSFAERIQFAKADPAKDSIDLGLLIEGTKTAPATTADLNPNEMPDSVVLQKGKSGSLEAIPGKGMDIRGQGQCLNKKCSNLKIDLALNEGAPIREADESASLEISTTAHAACTVKDLGAAEDDLSKTLKATLKNHMMLSVVETADGRAKYLSIYSLADANVQPFIRANLQDKNSLKLSVLTKDPAGSVTKSGVEAVISEAAFTKEPFILSMKLDYNGQPSAAVECKF